MTSEMTVSPGSSIPSGTGTGTSAGPTLLTPRHIGDVNRSRVLQAFCDHGPLTRAQLARLASVPRATIGAIVQGLMDDGLLEDYGPVHSPGKVGKPGSPVWFRPDAARCVAIAFDPAGISAALVSARGEVLARGRSELDTYTADAASLAAAATRAASSVMPEAGGILGIGVAIPGVCDTDKGIVLGSTPVPGVTGGGLVKALEAALGGIARVDNDARVQALGEKWFGLGRGRASFASVQTGAGLGVGLVINGVLYRGEDGRTGEIGHTVVDRAGIKCSCGLTGCWETIATLRWLRAQAAQRGLADAGAMTSTKLVALADGGDAGARELLDEYAANLSVGIVNLVHLLGLRCIVLHGDVVGGGEQLLAAIDENVQSRLLGHFKDEVTIELSGLNSDAALLGAAGLVLSETFAIAV